MKFHEFKSNMNKSLTEVDLDEAFKKGDTVTVLRGPHKGDKHEIIHDFGDGTYNVRPIRVSKIKYKLGAAKAKASDLKKEEVDLDEGPAKVWHLANKKFSLISDKDGYTLVTHGSGKETKLKAKSPADATSELVKRGYRESVDLGEGIIDQVKDIASKKSAAKIGGVMVDSFTASAISQIYDKVNDANKKKMEKLPITKLADLAFKMMSKD